MQAEQDIALSVFVRNPAKFEDMDLTGVNIMQGDALNAEDVKRAMDGQDVLLCSLEGDVLSMAKNIVAALETTSVKRIIWITGMGIHHEITGVRGIMLNMLAKQRPEYMEKKVLIVKGSPRKKGNTSTLADAFAKGAAESGHAVTEIVLKDKKIGDCMGCGVCQGNGGVCVQKDDMTEVYEEMKKADVIVLASPVYYYTWTSLMKRMIDRTFAVGALLTNKKFYLLSAGAAPEETYMKTMIDSFRQYVSCFAAGGNEVGDILFAYGTNGPADAKDMPVLEEAYQMGKAV